MNEKNLKGIGLFTLEIIGLISDGRKETLSEIESHFESKDIVEYLYNKYRSSFSIAFDNSTYNNEMLNTYFANYVGYINGNESRKYGIVNENDGLLLIPALLMDKVEVECIKWTLD